MNNFIDMNDVEQLIIDKLTGQIGDEEETRLEQLIARHSEVEQLWQQMQQVYAMRKAVSFDNSFNADTAWTAMQQKLSLQATPQQGAPDTVAIQHKPRINWMRYAAAAAVTGVIVVAAWLIIDYNSTSQPIVKNVEMIYANGKSVPALPGENLMEKGDHHTEAASWSTLVVPAGKSFNFKLGDQTEVWLNAASECRFPMMFSRAYRNIVMKGEGFFKVAHNPQQPFIVTVNGLTVTALGTEFNIKSYPNETSVVSLLEGSVLVKYKEGQELVLKPGESAVLAGNQLRKETFDKQNVVAWMKGLYYFHDEPLGELIVIAQRWFDINVKLDDPKMASMRFTGEINRNRPVNKFFENLSTTGGIRYEIENNRVLLRKH